jgi:hypothetical protein
MSSAYARYGEVEFVQTGIILGHLRGTGCHRYTDPNTVVVLLGECCCLPGLKNAKQDQA